MARQLLAGSLLNNISQSLVRYPGFRVLVWNPQRCSISDVARGVAIDPPLELTDYALGMAHSENIGYENADDPTVPSVSLTFSPKAGSSRFRTGWLADGVIVRVLVGDKRVKPEDWVPIFTGTFRGRPGEDRGTRADKSAQLSAVAYGREERYLNLEVTTDSFPADTDLGAMAYRVAWKHMGLQQEEILFGAFGVVTKHETNQLVEIPALDALYQCGFPAQKKPKFDGEAKLCMASFDLDKPALRVWKDNLVVRRLVAEPNDVEVMNQVVMLGQDHNMTKALQDARLLTEFDVTTGFFDAELKRRIYYGQDHTQRAQDTTLVTRKKISWSKASWSEVDEFSGTLDINTRYLRNVRAIIFATYLALQAAIAAIDFIFQAASAAAGTFLAILRLALQIAAQAALAGLLWSMNYIGRGHYEVWGRKFEYVYAQLMADSRLTGLDEDELRKYEYRNDFMSTMAQLTTAGRARLRRELLKNQLYAIEVLDDPALEVDDIVEDGNGARYYIITAQREYQPKQPAMLKMVAWCVHRDVFAEATAIEPEAVEVGAGYGHGYGHHYGRQL